MYRQTELCCLRVSIAPTNLMNMYYGGHLWSSERTLILLACDYKSDPHYLCYDLIIEIREVHGRALEKELHSS
jgi:hypothetical protein